MNKQGLYLSTVGAVTLSVFYTSLTKAGRWLSFALLCFLSILELYKGTGLGNNVGFNCWHPVGKKCNRFSNKLVLIKETKKRPWRETLQCMVATSKEKLRN